MKKFLKDSLRNDLELEAELTGSKIKTREDVKYELIRDIIALIIMVPLCVLSFIFFFVLGVLCLFYALSALCFVIREALILKYYFEIMDETDEHKNN